MAESAIEPIVISRSVSAAPEHVWRALVDPALVEQWFTTATPASAEGMAYRLDFGDSAVAGIVIEYAEGEAFAYTWTWEGEVPPQTTAVRWTVGPGADGGSIVTLRHDGWTEAGADAAARDDHAGYWEGYLDDLVDLLEGAGVTAPNAPTSPTGAAPGSDTPREAPTDPAAPRSASPT